MEHRLRVTLLSGFLFLAVFFSGILLSKHLPLWLDEQYSLTTVLNVSYKDIFVGSYQRESNNSPLFYSSQKFLCDMVAYNPSRLKIIEHPQNKFPWQKYWDDPFSNTYLRLFSILFMAFAVTALFYYFSLKYSFWWGSYGALVCLSYPLFWYYGFEARPYIHFFSLTVLQMLLLLELSHTKAKGRGLWILLSVANILLALTFTTSVFQTVCAGVYLFVWYRQNLSIQKMLAAFVVPLAISTYYYSLALKLTYSFSKTIPVYLIENMSYEACIVMGVFFLYGIWAWFCDLKKREQLSALAGQLFLFLSMMAAYGTVMIFVRFQAQQSPGGVGSNVFYERYLITLVPVGMIALTIFGRQLVLAVQAKWMKAGVIILLLGILAYRCTDLYSKMHAWVRYQWNF